MALGDKDPSDTPNAKQAVVIIDASGVSSDG